MKVLITGAGGQLGRALTSFVPPQVTIRGASHAQLNIADVSAVDSALHEFQPAAVINAAGFTRVDDAESNGEAAAQANTRGAEVLAAACRDVGAWLVHVSTDYVFDGGQSRPYDVNSEPHPLNVYGATKLGGELAVRRELPSQSAIVRTSWVYAAEGRNFLTTMLNLMTSRPQLSVVSDQVGAPTSAAGLARVLWALSLRRAAGLFNWCDSGVASWYDFAIAIAEEAVALHVLPSSPAILPIASVDYPTAARRPPFSLLDKRDTERVLGITAPHWRSALRETLSTVALKKGTK